MESYRLQVFLECARLKNFSRAAAVLHLSQPSISLHVKSLEDWCGTRLFERHGRRVELTEAGARLKEHAQRILASLATARQDVRDVVDPGRGRLATGGAGLPGMYVLPKAIGMFKSRYPKVDINMTYTGSIGIEQLLYEDAIEIAMFSHEPKIRGLVSEPYATSDVIIVAPPRHPLTRKRRVSLEELAAEPFVLREPESAGTRMVHRIFSQHNLDITVATEVSSHEAIKVAVAEGLGISAIARRWVENEVAVGQLVIVNAPDFKMEICHRIVHRGARTLSQAAKIFFQFLRERRPEMRRLLK
jgi:DNA-binding transcriptional LysR family regulator